jgi:hypothetical protein
MEEMLIILHCALKKKSEKLFFITFLVPKLVKPFTRLSIRYVKNNSKGIPAFGIAKSFSNINKFSYKVALPNQFFQQTITACRCHTSEHTPWPAKRNRNRKSSNRQPTKNTVHTNPIKKVHFVFHNYGEIWPRAPIKCKLSATNIPQL